MRSEGFPKRFCFRRWTEGPLEGMMELSADAEAYKDRARRTVALGTGAALGFLIILALILINDTWRIIYPFFSHAALPRDMATVLSTMALTVVFLALAFFSTLLLIQVWRYVSVMLKRFENVEDLLGAPRGGPAEPGETRKMVGPYLGLFNILGASSAFTKDIVRNMPQVCRQMKFTRTVLMLMPLYYLGLRLFIPLALGGTVPDMDNLGEILFDGFLISLSIVSAIAGLLVMEAGRFMEAMHAGLKFVDGVRSAPMPKVPEGNTPAERLAKYLEGECGTGTGSGEFAIRHATDDCLLLAIETSSAPDLETVKKFTESARKELDSMCVRPPRGRFIILYSPSGGADEISEEVEKHILANPITLGRGPGGGNSETVVQIMIEESGAYGMFPFAE